MSVKALFLLLLLFNQNSNSQKEYHFDYLTNYNYKENATDSIITYKEVTYSNSKDNSYKLKLVVKKDTIYSARIHDYSNQMIYVFKSEDCRNNLNDVSLFNTPKFYDYDLERCKKAKKNSYEVNYQTVEGKKVFSIKRFKNKRQKKLISESFYYTYPSDISKIQHYNFPPLATPLWCEKFKLNNKEIISHSYFIEKGTKKHVRDLKDIKAIDITLNITTTNNN